MTKAPDLDPEIRGLLEEIAADPRSCMRLAPRKALSSWFGGDEWVRTGEISGTKAEKHLVAVHREALAKLLYEAARIAYWKGPLIALRPAEGDGRPFETARAEGAIRSRARASIAAATEPPDVFVLLRQCVIGVRSESALEYATASVRLATRDETRLCLIASAARQSPRWAFASFARLASETHASYVRGIAWSMVGTLAVQFGRLDEARDAYQQSRGEWPMAWFSLLNLACLANRVVEARACLDQLDRHGPATWSIDDACALLAQWTRDRSQAELARARGTIGQLGEDARGIRGKVALCYG